MISWTASTSSTSTRATSSISAATARLGINVFNLFDTDATTEGSPRQDNNQTAGGAFFVGRPVLPRRLSVRLSFHF